MSDRREDAVVALLAGGPKTLREAQEALARDPAFGTRSAAISTLQSMARRGAIVRTPDVRQERGRRVAVFSLPGPTKEEVLRQDVLSFVREIATDYDHEGPRCERGACRRCNAERLLMRLGGQA